MKLLDEIALTFEKSRNIREKKQLLPILDKIQKEGYKSNEIYASFGEDAAAITTALNANQLILLSTDAILPEFIVKSPWAAGFSAIYVGIDDIMACGGTPVACSTTVSYIDHAMGEKIFQGIIEATNRFRLPLIRGHTTMDSPTIALTSTTIGVNLRENYISAGGTEVGDEIAIIWDAEGKPGTANRLYWDTITTKDGNEFYQKRVFIKAAIEKHILHACKDISNGGILGTLFQMLTHAKCGARIELDSMADSLKEKKCYYSLTDFLFAYLTSAFLVSFPKNQAKIMTTLANQSNMAFFRLGTAVSEKTIVLTLENNQHKLVEWS